MKRSAPLPPSIKIKCQIQPSKVSVSVVTGGANKLGRLYLCASEAFQLISVHLNIFYLITLGLTISKWGEQTQWVRAVKK